MSVDMIDAALGVVFRNNYQHMFPIWRPGEEVQYPSNRDIVIRNIGVDEGIPVGGTGAGSMVIGDLHGDEARHFLSPAEPHFREF